MLSHRLALRKQAWGAERKPYQNDERAAGPNGSLNEASLVRGRASCTMGKKRAVLDRHEVIGTCAGVVNERARM